MRYRQVTSEERYTLALLRKQGHNPSEIARLLGRHRSTICREIARNTCRYDGRYRAQKASERTRGRRSRARRNRHFGREHWRQIEPLLREQWSPEQVAGRLAEDGKLSISHETIYQHIWRDKAAGGDLHKHLRCSAKGRRKRYGAYDSRGRLAGKRCITERPEHVEERKEIGHWEIDTVLGRGNTGCIVTINERATGTVLIGQMAERTVEALNRRAIELIRRHPGPFRTITADNGTEFHGYEKIEQATGAKFYFAKPYHSWERGSNENLNGLIRQYLPKGLSMLALNQNFCDTIAERLNNRPRKRHGFKTPLERLYEN